jgi:hypothetical protein
MTLCRRLAICRASVRNLPSLGVSILSLSSAAAAAELPSPPPSAAEIKACVQQMDVANKWRFEWKLLEVGAPRHPRNNYEALSPFGGEGRREDFGYPVHVVYSVVGIAEIDSVYWLIRDTSGHWEIPAICVLR